MTQINLLRQVKNLNFPEGFLINGQIVTSVSSGNLTVAIKTLAGIAPSTTDPVYCRIGGAVRSITSALSITLNAGVNWLNAGSAELATKEIDYFTYLRWDSGNSSVRLDISRYPSFTSVGAAEIGGYAVEKGLVVSGDSGSGYPHNTVNIGRFNAILSAGAGYTWSIPATSVIINRPIYETRWLDGVPQVNIWTNAPTSITSSCKYKIRGNELIVRGRISGTANGSNSGTTLVLTTPFSTTLNYLDSIQGAGLWTDNATFDEGDNITSVYNASNLIRLGFATSTRRPNLLTYSYSFPI